MKNSEWFALMALTFFVLVKVPSLERADRDVSLRARRVEVVTNFVAGYIGGPPATFTTNEYGIRSVGFVHTIAITYPPTTNYITNIIIGTATKDLFRAEAMP